ncbi:hypothetical protein [Prauserella cavernicola]|uniref:Uncharacterized protein n=1 Tax=Prauserella cavernicola TaxID=2800127 RepID=A0A934V2A1_9PSEU|nr:hypothetical protein [Prauserella cavernicola]MBK1785141.1 hypothetical protein [Prauserella cavernicola]
MRSTDIAALLADGMQQQVTGTTELGWHTGVVLSWDDLTGLNSVEIKGRVFTNLKVLSTGSVQPFQPDDVVGVLRVGTTYFIFGKIRAPGAGAGERIDSDRVAASLFVPNNDTFGDLTGSYGPEVTVYIGSQRRALVIHSCEVIISGAVNIGQQGQIHQGVAISGATQASPASAITNAYLKGPAGVAGSASATTFITAENGLQQGLNTFTCKYRGLADGDQNLQVNNRVLTVMPF